MIKLKYRLKAMDTDLMIDTNTLAWRTMITREERGLKQIDLVKLINEPPYNIGLTVGAYSKIETGDTRTPKIETLVALSEILSVSLDYLIAGKPQANEQDVDIFISEEANIVGAIVDQMIPAWRQFVVDTIKLLNLREQEVNRQLDSLQERNKELAENEKRLRDMQLQFTKFLVEIMPHIDDAGRRRARSILHDINGSRE